MRAGSADPSSCVTDVAEVASPHITRWPPHNQISPSILVALAGSAATESSCASSSAPGPATNMSISRGSNPVKARSKFSSSSSLNSSASSASSHSAHVAERFIISLKALTWAGLHSSHRMIGTSVIPSFSAAFSRRCPSTISPSLRTSNGILKPNSRIEATIRFTAPSLFLGFRIYGTSFSTGKISIVLSLGIALAPGAHLEPALSLTRTWLPVKIRAARRRLCSKLFL